jgi:ABC-type multidrug transport system fused ATPase/permease subunit
MVSFKRLWGLEVVAKDGDLGEDIEMYGAEEEKIREGKIELLNFALKDSENEGYIDTNVCLRIMPSEKIALVGKEHSGKSTFVRCLLGLSDPFVGRIEIDSTPLKSIPLALLWSKISVITDNTPIFNSTLRHNIDPSGKFTDQEILISLKKAKLEGFLKKCKDSLDIKVGKGGIRLGEREKKLIFIARAILKNNKIIVVEESGKKDVATGKTYS